MNSPVFLSIDNIYCIQLPIAVVVVIIAVVVIVVVVDVVIVVAVVAFKFYALFVANKN